MSDTEEYMTSAEAISRLADMSRRAHESETAPPLLYADQAIADEWVLVPRRHIRALINASIDPDTPDETYVFLCAEIVADARRLGVTE